MWRIPLLTIAVAMTSGAQVINLEFRSRYGEAYIQRFRIDAQLSVAARYDDSGAACAFQISPSNFVSVAFSEAPTAAIDLVVDRLLPHYLTEHDRGSAPVNAADDVEDFGGWQIRHERPSPFTPAKTSFAELTAKAQCSSENRLSLQLQFGPPEYERFHVRPGLALSVSYAQDRSVKRIEIRRDSTALNDEPRVFDRGIDATAAEQVLDEVLTPAIRKALRPGLESITGQALQSTSTYGSMMVTRNSVADGSKGKILGYSVSWRQGGVVIP